MRGRLTAGGRVEIVSALEARARGDALGLDLMPCGPEEGTKFGDHPVGRLGST